MRALIQLYGVLLGTHARAGLIGQSRLYLWILALPVVVFVVVAAFVTAVDPYEVYPWGEKPRLARDRYNPGAALWLLNVVAKDDYDTFIIGGSTAQEFLPADAVATLAGTKRAFAITYNGPKPRDLKLVMEKVTGARNLKRVILSFDTSYLFPPDAGRSEFPYALYGQSGFPYLRIVGAQALALSYRLLRGEEFFVPAWDIRGNERDRDSRYRNSLLPRTVERDRRTVRTHKTEVAAAANLDCSAFPSIAIIKSFAAGLEARGARLDVVVPPYSYLIYYAYLDPSKRFIVLDRPALATFTAMRRCLVKSLDGQKNARVFAFDLNRDIVEDMANYFDEAHLYGSARGREMFTAIDSGDSQLTVQNFEAYAVELTRRVQDFEYVNSRLPKVEGQR